MPYFADHRVLFLHIPKNAGMHVERCLGLPLALLDETAPTDRSPLIMTLKRWRKTLDTLSGRAEREAMRRRLVYDTFGGLHYYQHATYREHVALRLIDPADCERAHILAVHRDPLARAISIYTYWNLAPRMDFETFVETWLARPWDAALTYGQQQHVATQASFIDGAPEDRLTLLPFDDLDNALQAFATSHGLTLERPGRRINAARRGARPDPPPHIKARIAELYRVDYERFGYPLPTAS